MRLLRARSATQMPCTLLPMQELPCSATLACQKRNANPASQRACYLQSRTSHPHYQVSINKAGRHTAAATRQSRRREVAELKMHSSMTVTLSMILKHNYNGNRVGNLSVPVRSDRETIRQ